MSAAGSWPRVIVHADMDAFYAAVEQLDDPRLRGRAILIGMDSPRSVVLTASYEARPSGAGSAMPMQRARRLCPEALVIPPRFERYQQISKLVMGALAGFSPVVEPLSLDEAFVDMSGSSRLFGSPRAIGAAIKTAITEATGGLTASVGVASTRYVAKVASGFAKPEGLTIVAPDEARAWLAPLPVAQLWGAGAKTAARLRELGFETIGQVAQAPPNVLEAAFGALGQRFVALANAFDPRPVVGTPGARSLGCERTLVHDISARADIEAQLRASADTVARRLRRRGAVAGGVRIKLKRSDFTVITRQGELTPPTDVSAALLARAVTLLGTVRDAGPFRLVGLAAFALEEQGGQSPQMSLAPEQTERIRRLEVAVDKLAQRYGTEVIRRARDLTREPRVGPSATLDFLDDD